jgi:hypothetical protein
VTPSSMNSPAARQPGAYATVALGGGAHRGAEELSLGQVHAAPQPAADVSRPLTAVNPRISPGNLNEGVANDLHTGVSVSVRDSIQPNGFAGLQLLADWSRSLPEEGAREDRDE